MPAEEVAQVFAGQTVQVIDTGFAIHLQAEGISKGTALLALARDMGLSPKDFLLSVTVSTMSRCSNRPAGV